MSLLDDGMIEQGRVPWDLLLIFALALGLMSAFVYGAICDAEFRKRWPERYGVSK